jgi:hypothetical protein
MSSFTWLNLFTVGLVWAIIVSFGPVLDFLKHSKGIRG